MLGRRFAEVATTILHVRELLRAPKGVLAQASETSKSTSIITYLKSWLFVSACEITLFSSLDPGHKQMVRGRET